MITTKNLLQAPPEPPFALLVGIKESGKHQVLQNTGSSEAPGEQRGILCRSCNARLTSTDRRITVAGRHDHTFCNPAGIVFTIRCFSAAPGCLALGKPSDLFSWFPGYLWQCALCRLCQVQSGWHFSGPEHSFYTLITERIIDPAGN